MQRVAGGRICEDTGANLLSPVEALLLCTDSHEPFVRPTTPARPSPASSAPYPPAHLARSTKEGGGGRAERFTPWPGGKPSDGAAPQVFLSLISPPSRSSPSLIHTLVHVTCVRF